MGVLPKDYKKPAGKYLKLEEGETHIRILGTPIFGYEGWRQDGEKRKPVRKHSEFDFKPGEVIKDKDNKVRHFWAMFVWNYEAARIQVLHITQQTIQDALYSLDNSSKWGALTEYDVCISAKGSGLNREYQTLPDPKSDAPDAVGLALANYGDRLDLNRLFDNGDPFGDDGSTADPDGDIPF